VITGFEGEYQWLEADHCLNEFKAICANAITGKYLVISAVDAGVFYPSSEDQLLGWREIGGLAYSPLIESVASLPANCCCRDCCCPDEWYLFDSRPEFLGSICEGNPFETEIKRGNFIRIATFCNFRFSEPEMKAIVDMFWEQIHWVRPESYVADCDSCLIFATRDRALFNAVRERLCSTPSTLSAPEPGNC